MTAVESKRWRDREQLTVTSHLAVIGGAGLGHGTLTVHQEAVPPPFLRQSVLVALSDVAVQLALLTADGFHILEEKGRDEKPWQHVISLGHYFVVRMMRKLQVSELYAH